LLVAGFVFLTFVTFPPAIPREQDSGGVEADTSLSMILEHARQHGLQFGTEHTYTYGPLGFLIFFQYTPRYAALHMVVDVLLAITATAGLLLVALRLHLLLRILLLGGFVLIASNSFPRTDLVIDTALLCFGLLCFLETGRRLTVYATTLAVLAAFAALAKNSFLFVASLTVLIVAIDLLARGRGRLAGGLLGGFLAGFFLGWMLLGQNLAHLPTFVVNALAMVRGYNAALGWEESMVVGWYGRLVAVLVLSLLVLTGLAPFPPAERRSFWRRILLFGWLFALSFAAWKHGYVRAHSCHLRMFFGFLAVLVLAVQAVPVRSGASIWMRGLGLTCSLLTLALVQWLYFPSLTAGLRTPFQAAGDNLVTLLNPAGFLDRMDAIIQENRSAAQLPGIRRLVGPATIDVFGRRQGFALFNDLNYHPRPLPQSYAAVTADLMRLNQDFYLSTNAPEFVLFEFSGLDRKLPILEDAWALRHLLINYQPVGDENGLLLLRKQDSQAPRLTLLRQETLRLGERIELRDLATNRLWMEIDLRPSLLGRLRQFYLRPPPVRLSAWSNGGQDLLTRGRSPASMLSAGFLASPLLERTEDVQALYAGAAGQQPSHFAVEVLPEEKTFWQDTLKVRIYRLENSFSSAGAAHLKRSAGAPEFTLFRKARWRPDQPPPGNIQEQIALGLMLLLPAGLVFALVRFARFVRGRAKPARWGALLLGNSLVLFLLLSLTLLAGELYFRFGYDTTDSLGYIRIAERWVQRHWQVNAAGCRDNVEYQPALIPGRPRITFIGDSFTAGHGIPNVNDRFANRLRQQHPDWDIQVLANVGLDTGREFFLVKRAARLGYQFDQVVLVYCLNDIGDLLPEGGLNAAQLAAGYANHSWILSNSYFINLLYHRYKAARSPDLRSYFPLVRDAYTGPLWEEQKQRLKAFRDLVQANGGRLSVVTFPFLHALAPGQPYEHQFIHEELDQLWRDLGVPHLDLLPVYRNYTSRQLTVNRYDAHPNEFASQLAAEAIGGFLSPRISTPPPPP
jgi:hypothetical protein